MTINQAIDGVLVSRELLERIISHCKFWHDHPYLEAIQGIDKELRVLLDSTAEAQAVHEVQWNGIHGPEGWKVVDAPTFHRCTGRLWDRRIKHKPAAQPQGEPVEWGAPKTVRQLIRQLETLDQDLRPLSMLRVPASVFEDGKERVRATHLSFSHERVDGQWLAPFKSDGEKVLAFWCRMEQPAPVAVVMPERMEVPSADCPERINAQGWNACLDELKRLNPSL